jgi:hypothetical protein
MVVSAKSMVNQPVSQEDSARKISTLSLKTILSSSARFTCSAKIDTMMPFSFDWFSLRINGSVRYSYYSSSNDQSVTFGGKLNKGENLLELVVEAGPSKPAFSRNTGSGYGTGQVWLESCTLEKD